MKDKYIKSILFKNNILIYKGKNIKESYDEYFEKPFTEFVNRYENTKEMDPGFFHLEEEIPRRVLDTINLYRYAEDKKDFNNDKANEIIKDMNLVNSTKLDDKIKIILDYWEREEEDRGVELKEGEDLLSAIRNDSILYTIIKDDMKLADFDLENETNRSIYQILIMQGINNFISKCPELFKDETFKNNAINKIDEFEFSNRKLKKSVKTLKKEMINL